MKRRPFLILALVIGAAAIVQAAFGPKSTPADYQSDVPEGTVCTVCGPVPTGATPMRPPRTLDAAEDDAQRAASDGGD